MNGPTGRVRGLLSLVALIWLGVVVRLARAEEAPAQPELGRLQRHVATLASAEFGGRRGVGARKAEAYITESFRGLGLEPLFAGQFTQDIPGQEPGMVVGRNVGARLPGADPALREEWVIVSAHYDHLGVRNGVLYPGADDNASGVAMLLEVARCLAAGAPPRRSVVFVAFDLEENGLWGSRHFVDQPPVPLERIKLFLTADMLGGSLGGVCTEQLFVLGSERAPALRPWIEEAAAGRPIQLALVGSDLLVIDRSDYGPFRARRIPYLFFSTGEGPRYHRPEDTAESLDYPKLETASRVIYEFVRRAGVEEALPGWNAQPDAPVAEARALRDVLRILLQHREHLKISATQVTILTSTLEQLEGIVERGVFTVAERVRIVRVAQLILYTAL